MLKLRGISGLDSRGIAFAILAPLLYAAKSAAVKFAPSVRIEVIVFLRFFFDFLILLPFFLMNLKKLKPKQGGMHLFRTLFATASIFCSVYGIRHLALVDAIILENMLPLFIPIVVWIWHKEKISSASWVALFIGFSSLFFILKPQLNLLHLASFASIGAAFATAISSVSIKTLSKTESPITILFYFYLISSLITLYPCCQHWENIPAAPSFWWPFVLISIFGVSFQYAITKAYSLVPAHVVGSFVYFSVLYSAFLGWIIWHEKFDAMQMCGAALLVSAGLFILRSNQRSIKLKKSGLLQTASNRSLKSQSPVVFPK
ncbi:MAG: DMT family transporter [Verrucomicrobia bacterium]|nr:DMT family transporter [Verrucomicrobiota bacterium]